MNAATTLRLTRTRVTRPLDRGVDPFWGSVTIRVANAGDEPSLDRLAELDSTARPAGAILIGLVRQRVVAALSLEDGTEIADPFVATGDILQLLRLRAGQLNSGPRRRGTLVSPRRVR